MASADALLEQALAAARVQCAICDLSVNAGKCTQLATGSSGGERRWQRPRCQRVSLALYRKFGSIEFFRRLPACQQAQARRVLQSVCRYGDSMLAARVAERTGRHPRAAELGAPEPEPEPEAAPPHPDRWHELFRSEVVWDSLNPRFAAGMTLRERCDPAFLGSRANTWLRFVVVDADDKNPGKPVAELGLVGETELPLADWLKAADGGGRTTRPLRRPRSKKAAAKSFGALTMVSERLLQPPGSGGGVARVSMRAADLPNVDGVFGKSDPFVVWKRGPPVA